MLPAMPQKAYWNVAGMVVSSFVIAAALSTGMVATGSLFRADSVDFWNFINQWKSGQGAVSSEASVSDSTNFVPAFSISSDYSSTSTTDEPVEEEHAVTVEETEAEEPDSGIDGEMQVQYVSPPDTPTLSMQNCSTEALIPRPVTIAAIKWLAEELRREENTCSQTICPLGQEPDPLQGCVCRDAMAMLNQAGCEVEAFCTATDVEQARMLDVDVVPLPPDTGSDVPPPEAATEGTFPVSDFAGQIVLNACAQRTPDLNDPNSACGQRYANNGRQLPSNDCQNQGDNRYCAFGYSTVGRPPSRYSVGCSCVPARFANAWNTFCSPTLQVRVLGRCGVPGANRWCPAVSNCGGGYRCVNYHSGPYTPTDECRCVFDPAYPVPARTGITCGSAERNNAGHCGGPGLIFGQLGDGCPATQRCGPGPGSLVTGGGCVCQN